MTRLLFLFAVLACFVSSQYFPPCGNGVMASYGVGGYSPPCNAITYYVDNAGSDSADGKTPATAWQTISKVNSTTLSPGQTVGFKAGGIWRETLTPGQSGSAGSPITFTAYGSGQQPVVSGSDLTSGWTDSTTPKHVGLTISNASYTVPSDWNNAANTIEAWGSGGNGHDGNSSSAAGAGGGTAGYSKSTNVSLTPSGTVSYVVAPAPVADGANGAQSYFCNSTTNCGSIAGTAVKVGANGGIGATTNSIGGAGASTTGSVGTATTLAGCSGGSSTSDGGGGGGAPGPNGACTIGGAGSSGKGGGGGGADGGTAGAAGAAGATGGTNSSGTGAGIAPCGAGSIGGGGAGGTGCVGGANSIDQVYGGSYGPGSGPAGGQGSFAV